MQVKRFVAADMRRALELVRQALGPDAIILSSNRTAEGVELLTTLASDDELMQLQQSGSPRVATPAYQEPGYQESVQRESPENILGAFKSLNSTSPGLASGKTGKQLADEIEQARLRMLASRNAEASAKEFLVGKQQKVNAAIPRRAAQAPIEPVVTKKPQVSAADRYPLIDDEPVVALSQTKPPVSKPVVKQTPVPREEQVQLSELQAELADMRFLLEQQLDRITGVNTPAGSPVLSSIGRRLERIGLPTEAVSRVLGSCNKERKLSDAWSEALANLAHQMPVIGKDVVDQGGIFAFVGPTGVGKTTTIGKLAARYVLQHGADKVALVTTDTYRIAAHDQLRSFGRILRVPVKVVDENNPLEQVLHSLRHYSLVLIDTAGFRHGDPHLKAQLKALADQPAVKSYLVLSTNSQQQMLKASIHAYGAVGLKGCVLTKLDETASMGEALGVIMQSRLPIAYTTDGQDIPRDIQVARAHQLVSKAAAMLRHTSTNQIARR
jgi:flagellar biosynthesis protein FlhF